MRLVVRGLPEVCCPCGGREYEKGGEEMIETLFAWLLLIFGICSGDPAWYIGSGVFAIAAQISRVVDRIDRRKTDEE